jgi:hypothetical protein
MMWELGQLPAYVTALSSSHTVASSSCCHQRWTSDKSRLTVQGGLLRYGRYDQSRVLQTVVWEAEQEARALGVPVRPVVAVHGAKVRAPRGQLELQGVTVVEAKRLRGLLRSLPPQPGWDFARMTAVGQLAARSLPPAF